MDLRNRLSLCFRNNWGIKVNLLYWLHLQYCRLRSKCFSFTREEKETAKHTWKKGYGMLKKVDVTELNQIVAKKFESMILTQGCGSLSRHEVERLAEPIFKALKEVENGVCAYYKSFFKVNWVDVQKIIPGEQPKGSSFSYHIDDSPYSIGKIFIYLTDTYRDNGAFRAFDYEWTDLFLKKGLLKSTQPGAMRDSCQSIITKEDEHHLRVMEGKAGTAFIFDNNLAHKGTLPVKGCRMHISMEIMPSTRPLTLDAIVKACSRIPADNYNPKPFAVSWV